MRYENDSEKPYAFVPFHNQSPSRKPPAGQAKISRDQFTGWLELELETLTPMQVASGRIDFVRAAGEESLAALQVTNPVRDQAGAPRRVGVIPGASFKGTVRSLLEAISPSCLRITGRNSRPYAPRRLNPCDNADSLCPACRLFGAQNYQGQLSFEDALLPLGSLVLIGTPLLWTPARGGRGLPNRYLNQRGEAIGRKFYFHARRAGGSDQRVAIKTGVRIPTRVHFINLSEEELGLLLAAIGLHPQHPFPIKLGGGKPVGLGSVKVHLKTVCLLHGESGVRHQGRLGGQTSMLQGEELVKYTEKWVKQAESHKILLTELLKELAQILAESGLEDNQAPADPY